MRKQRRTWRLIEEADLSFRECHSEPRRRRGIPFACAWGIPRSARDDTDLDGRHRVAKAALQRQETIEAVQFASDPEPDYVGVPADELPYD